jgi:hypothetical protein
MSSGGTLQLVLGLEGAKILVNVAHETRLPVRQGPFAGLLQTAQGLLMAAVSVAGMAPVKRPTCSNATPRSR